MAHRFLHKDIALQAGVGIATVDRVLNGRGGVRPQTQRRVEQAIAELERQETQIGLTGRKFIIDVVIEAPRPFFEDAQTALTANAPLLQPAVIRARYVNDIAITDDRLEAIGADLKKRGSHGLILMARDTAKTNAVVASLVAAGIPVVAFATDLPLSARVAYAGMDNRAAGATAAYLAGQWLGSSDASILVTTRNARFRGEEEREIGFRIAIRERYDHLGLVEITQGAGGPPLGPQVATAIAEAPNLRAVYSIGGSNLEILEAFANSGRDIAVYIAHDLDAENSRLLDDGRLNAVLHHDLGRDMTEACKAIMRYHRALPAAPAPSPNPIQVITPFNRP
ncbi:LacI family DNA-binding transcriptional regulator [Bauldia sp.]|uniref:LacI family DNA-binding transcriptional regulator n=1 Tax=Bauldia sp. TaxID=2575872 RepID=UPI003BA8D776